MYGLKTLICAIASVAKISNFFIKEKIQGEQTAARKACCRT